MWTENAAHRNRGVVAGFLVTAVVISLLLVSCGGKTVTRLSPEATTDLSGRWNDTDSRLVAEAMIADCLNRPWTAQHMQGHSGKLPVVIAGAIRNLSTEHIAVGTFLNDIERALINSGRVQVVASASDRGELRLERADQWENASPETVKRLGQELGADYMLTGTINTITDQEGGKRIIYYQIDLTLTDIESNVKIWPGQHKIKKYISRGKYKP
ncbi:MAG: penicillin-binding protein activator LpoB [Candidatus Eisenbacteria sp.]|nr:penicillin-binding protein activator LpoB [Candidatus Eisenbacteria bacterium]